MQKDLKKVVVFGGGTGLSALLTGLKDFPLQITAVITVADSGYSSGKLRDEFRIPAVGDIRKVITNLSELPNEVKEVMEYRFKTKSDLDGHSVGNLVLTSIIEMTNDLPLSIEYMSKLMDVRHKVLPLSSDNLTLVAEYQDGRVVENEDEITNTSGLIKKVYYKEKYTVTPEIFSAVEEADLIILSMGSLYTSIIPHLISKDVVKVLKKSKAKIMYLCNAMTQPGETDNFTVGDHLDILEEYSGKNVIDVVVASNTKLPKEILLSYSSAEEKDPVIIDKEEIKAKNIELIESNLLTIEEDYIRHNSYKLSSVIFSYLMR